MLAGFAAHRALAHLGVDTFESYPHLVFSLWKTGREVLPPKSQRKTALTARQSILTRLAADRGIDLPSPKFLDEADAAVLAITARLSEGGTALVFQSGTHGRFLLPLKARDLSAYGAQAFPGNALI